MDATDDLTIVQLGPEDAAGGLALSSDAQWNQNEADWNFFLSKALVFGVHAPDRRLIATAALMPYSASDAWISMVLVTASWRRRGLATRLVDECLSSANRLDVTCWLDATPAGAAVYGPLGFTPTIQLQRLRLDRPLVVTGERCWKSSRAVPARVSSPMAMRSLSSVTAAPPATSVRSSRIALHTR
jgi:GNAT superfamily N-acetyltransferase